MWGDNKNFAVEIIQEAEKRLTDEYDVDELADFVERDDSYGINDKEWGKILRNKATEMHTSSAVIGIEERNAFLLDGLEHQFAVGGSQ